jgi:hypothetical protein
MRAIALRGAYVLVGFHLLARSHVRCAARYRIAGYSALVVQAGTATSTRGRGEANSFNVLQIEAHQIVVHRLGWRAEEKAFGLDASQTFVQRGSEWFEQLADGQIATDP